jgi:hypothetical protein
LQYTVFYLGLYEGLKPTGEDQNPLKDNIQHVKAAHFLDFFVEVFDHLKSGSGSSPQKSMRILADPHPDPQH